MKSKQKVTADERLVAVQKKQCLYCTQKGACPFASKDGAINLFLICPKNLTPIREGLEKLSGDGYKIVVTDKGLEKLSLYCQN